MRFDWRKALRAVACAVAITIIYGGFLGVLFLFGSLGAFPAYITKIIPFAGGATLIALVLQSSGYINESALKWLGRITLAVCVVSAVYVGWGVYQNSIPTMDDRGELLWEYRPFDPESKAVSLDEPSTLQFDLDTACRLRLDGATALYPVYSAFVQAVFPDGYRDSPYTSVAACSNTVYAYEYLIKREVDMIFAAAPSQAQLNAAEQAGMELHLTPIGREAFVFFVNRKNPVKGLTVEEIQGIYTGDITNWKEVGGRNQTIRPFQRAQDSGSQSALERLMDGLPLIEPEQEDRVSAMDGIIRQVANYRNYSNALGFSFRFYATEMVTDNQIRLLALNGVEPTKETIRDGTYPISSEFYAVTASPIGQPAPEEYDAELSAFLDWILSEQGQKIIEKTGYAALNN